VQRKIGMAERTLVWLLVYRLLTNRAWEQDIFASAPRWMRPVYLVSKSLIAPDLAFSSLIQRRLESTHLLLAQTLHSSTCRPYRSPLGIELQPRFDGTQILEMESSDSSSSRFVTSFPYSYPNLTLTLSSPCLQSWVSLVKFS